MFRHNLTKILCSGVDDSKKRDLYKRYIGKVLHVIFNCGMLHSMCYFIVIKYNER